MKGPIDRLFDYLYTHTYINIYVGFLFYFYGPDLTRSLRLRFDYVSRDILVCIKQLETEHK